MRQALKLAVVALAAVSWLQAKKEARWMQPAAKAAPAPGTCE
jgi:hypothetical protein